VADSHPENFADRSRLSVHDGAAETLGGEGVGDSVKAFRRSDQENSPGIEGRVQASTQSPARRVVEIDQKIPT
jgi:hypothetical protein